MVVDVVVRGGFFKVMSISEKILSTKISSQERAASVGGSANSVMVYDAGYWIPLLASGPIGFFAARHDEWVALLVFGIG